MAKCEKCKTEVFFGPGKEYIYVLLCIGKPGQERPAFFHKDCFLEILKVKSNLFKELGEKVVFS